MYFGLEVIQEYACGGENVFCEAGPAMVREFLHGDPARYPEAVAMVTYDLMPTEVPYGEPPAPPTSVNPQVYHYLHDVLGSVIGVVNETGTLVERFTLDAGERLCRSPRAGRTRSIRRRVKGTTYDPYGKVFIEKWDDAANEGSGARVESASECGTGVPACGQMPYSPTGNPFLWTGHRYDAAVGLYHTLFRFYEPVLGRWLQRDPIEYAAGFLNLYEYVLSAPLYWIDPLGLLPADGGDMVDEIERMADAAGKQNACAAGIAASGGGANAVPPDHEFGERLKDAVIEAGINFIPVGRIGTLVAKLVPKKLVAKGRKIWDGVKDKACRKKPTTPPKVEPPGSCPKGPPKAPKEFLPPTNSPRMPPTKAELPPGHTVREMPPSPQCRNGYWRQYNQHGQPVNPRTGKPPSNVTRAEFEAQTHVEFPKPATPSTDTPIP